MLILMQNLHKGVIRDEELYRMKLAEQKLLREQQQGRSDAQ